MTIHRPHILKVFPKYCSTRNFDRFHQRNNDTEVVLHCTRYNHGKTYCGAPCLASVSIPMNAVSQLLNQGFTEIVGKMLCIRHMSEKCIYSYSELSYDQYVNHYIPPYLFRGNLDLYMGLIDAKATKFIK